MFLKSRVKDRLEFGIKHFAGTAYYNIENYLSKNRWVQPGVIFDALRESKDASVIFIFTKKNQQQIKEKLFEDDIIYIASSLCKSLNGLTENLEK